MSRIAFFGYTGAFDHRHIGGVESIIRRLTTPLAAMGDEVSFILYGCPENRDVEVGPGVNQRSFTTFEEAVGVIKAEYDHVVSVYLKPFDRIRYAAFRRKYNDSVLFHHLYCVWHESRPKRELLFSFARIVPYSGTIFCVSPRLHRYVSSWAKRSVLLLPPVPRDYFCTPQEKPRDGILRITYAGRLDPAKGANEAVRILRAVARRKNFEPHVLGYAWSHDPQSLGIRDLLREHPDIMFDLADQQNWNADTERRLRESLRRTDILILPYRRLSSTVDTPLLLLEGMANLCVIVTPSLGDLHDIYASRRFGLHHRWNVDQVMQVIDNAEPCLEEERYRLAQRNAGMKFCSEDAARIFRNAINSNC
jgi:glycosyltransferase involved in cell wall biosynthesis